MVVVRARGEPRCKGRRWKMGKSIICGVDGSPDAQAALKVAAQFADRLGSTLILAHVVELAHVAYAAAYPLGGFAGPMATADETESEEEAAERLLEGVAADAGLADAERRVTIGHPAERLADVAEEQDADLIVVGNKGMTGAKRFLLGSVPNKVSHHAPCSVLIIRTT